MGYRFWLPKIEMPLVQFCGVYFSFFAVASSADPDDLPDFNGVDNAMKSRSSTMQVRSE